MSLGFFIANGVSSKDFNTYLTDAGVYGIAERDTSKISIQGKNGDLLLDNGRYKNKKMTYPALIIENFKENFENLLDFLVSQKGYIRLEDSFLPDMYVLARYSGETNPKKMVDTSKKGSFVLTFDRKPQKFIKEGDKAIILEDSGTIKNQYNQDALPLIRAYGTGSFSIGDISVQITSANGYTDIDCELQEAYKDDFETNCNSNIVLTNDVFPKLVKGSNLVTMSGITKLEIKPRWWKL